MEENIYFISGHVDLSKNEFEEHYMPKIRNALLENSSFVVGDARGADKLAQEYLFGKAENVTVYHMFDKPRFNVGFRTSGGYTSDGERSSNDPKFYQGYSMGASRA